MTPNDLKKLNSKQLAELLSSYNLYAVSNGGNKSVQLVSGPAMMEEIKRRLVEPRMVTTDPAVLIAPIHVHIDGLGKTLPEVQSRLYDIIYDITEHGLWPFGMYALQDMHKYVCRYMHQESIDKLFTMNIVVLSIVGQGEPPADPPEDSGRRLLYPAPFEGWYFQVLPREMFPSFDKETFTRQGFFNLVPPTPNKLDII